jgi:signal transduction histidine kinase
MLSGLAVQLLTLPIAAWVLLYVVREVQTRDFMQHVRTMARAVADGFEAGSALGDSRETARLLDSINLTGEGVYAELLDNGHYSRSLLNQAEVAYAGRQDLEFSEHAGPTYFIVLPIVKTGHDAEVRLGFDKRPTLEAIALSRRRILQILVGYGGLLLALTALSVGYVTRPLSKLRQLARQVAFGNHEQRLSADSTIPELHNLAADLEKMRAELVAVNAKLRTEIEVRERSEAKRRELESQLRRQQRLQTIGTLAGGIAHEINNTLVPIMLFSQSILDELPPDSPSREEVLGILRSARRSREVVNQVLTFSGRLDLGKVERLDLREPVEEALRLFATLAPASVMIVRHFEEPSLAVIANRTSISLITMNLCTNGFQAMSTTGGTLNVHLAPRRTTAVDRPGVAAGTYMELRIQDNGHGMDCATLERIFEPFFTTRGEGEGTGLGLAVVHGIVENLGGTLLVESTPGVGSDFRVLFPVAEEQAS